MWVGCVFGLVCAVVSAETPSENSSAVSDAYRAIWNTEEQAKIDADIERNRKADYTVSLDVPDGTVVRVCQTSHDFKFGSNIFLFGQFDSEEKNRRYADAFTELFNAATVAFYWKTLEPVQGKPRFAADSERIYRRPATDPVVDFCEEHGLDIHGHALIYGIRRWGHPEWLPTERKAMEAPFEAHIRQLAERYGARIAEWDVVNESIDQANRGLMPDDYMYKCFRWAEEYFPPEVRLSTNECDLSWGPNRRYVEIVRDLIDRGAKIGLVGVQAHLFSPEQVKKIADGADLHTPKKIRAVLDTLTETERPIHISEITISAPSDDDAGQAIQAVIAVNLYRLWFSYPQVCRITWWNAVDGGAAEGEPSFSGLLTAELEKKPVYDALFDLIHRQWRTETTATVENGHVAWRGFRGNYRLEWTSTDGTKRSQDVTPTEAP